MEQVFNTQDERLSVMNKTKTAATSELFLRVDVLNL